MLWSWNWNYGRRARTACVYDVTGLNWLLSVFMNWIGLDLVSLDARGERRMIGDDEEKTRYHD